MKRGIKNLILSVITLFAIILILYFVIAITTSSPPVNVWNSTLDGPQNNADLGLDLVLDNESNIYITGNTYWNNASTTDIYIGKFNSEGENLWNVTFDGLRHNFDSGDSIALDNESNIYIGGYSLWSTASNSDFYLGKFNSTGSNIWNTTFNGLGNSSDVARAIILDNQSNIYATGESWTTINGPELYLGKYNSTGSNIWNLTFTAMFPYDNYGYGVAVDNQSNLYVVGSIYWSTDTCNDIYLGKFNSTTGDNIWNSTIAGPHDDCDVGLDIVLDNESNIYITGLIYLSSAATSDIYVGKFNSTTGSNIWNSTISTSGQSDDSGESIAIYNNSLYITGRIETDSSNKDIYLGKFNSTTGDNIWNFTLNGEQGGVDTGYGIAVENESDINVIGFSRLIFVNTTDIYLGRFSELSIEESCTESWTCTDWSTCSDGIQTRTCTDVNACGTTTNKPTESQSCTSSEGGSGSLIITYQNNSSQSGEESPQQEECIPNEKRCLGNQIQSCSESKNWIINETCEFGCENGQCIKDELGINPIILYPAIGIAVVGILTSFLIQKIPRLKKLFKK